MDDKPFWQQWFGDIPASEAGDTDLGALTQAMQEQVEARYEGSSETGHATVVVDGNSRAVEVRIDPAGLKSTVTLQRDIIEAYQLAQKACGSGAATRWGNTTGLDLDPEAADPFAPDPTLVQP